MKKKLAAVLALVASLSLVTACSSSGEPVASQTAGESTPGPADGESNAPAPDTAGVPDIVATVNGEKITKADFVRIYEGQFPQVLMQAQMSGQGLDQDQLRKQTVEGLISTELLIQEAARKNINATAKDVESALDDIAEGNNMDKTEFLAFMQEQGLDESAVQAQVRTQLQVERLIANEVGSFKPTTEELKAAYEVVLKQQKEQSGQGPAYEQVKPELEQQLKLQKEAAAVKEYVQKLRKGAKISVQM